MTIFQLLFLILSLGATSAQAATSAQGKTADGCSYQVINGVYHYSCAPPAEVQAPLPTQAPTATPVIQSAPPVIAPIIIGAPADQSHRVLGENPKAISTVEEDAPKSNFEDSVYAGANIGSNTVTAGKDSSTALGVNLGTDLDEYTALEFGYSYAKQNTLLGLAGRPGPDIAPSLSSPTSDSNLTTHLLSVEALYHLTALGRRLRPFIGGGLAWRSSTLAEDLSYQSSGNYFSSSSSSAELNQKSLGALASLGTQLRITKNIDLAARFRYFLPLSRQDAVFSSSKTHLVSTDKDLTGASQYQLLAGLVVYF